MSSQLAAALALCSALMLASGCVPSKYPLSDEKTSKVDPQLVGRWVIQGDEKHSDFVVTQGEGKNGLKVSSVGEDQTFTVFATEIGGLRYLSVPHEDDQGVPTAEFDILLYEVVDANTLKFYTLEWQRIYKSILSGELAGFVETKRDAETFRVSQAAQLITDSPEYLARYLKKHGKACFFDTVILTCVRQPE